ncbi:SDR family NAD(P)-dependent oxidoreductase [Streptomyces marispadix]|uniref:SDR family NAD(P)-dependent oxidoreductase n=1 Tax=Streptomyces marispadix TaxID=2922868 RepID=A0ABS9SXB1_9ACTN|nr:SDR family NAD(P)-dependent oxidoreductase [Streptomyces marispadix]MCH6160828.1 SDR family NAD(P)-dependent oxidoreductase [Streptomyces marispadix]
MTSHATHATSLTELHELIRTGQVGQEEALRLVRAWQQRQAQSPKGQPPQGQRGQAQAGRAQVGQGQPGQGHGGQPGPQEHLSPHGRGVASRQAARDEALRERVCDVVTRAVSELLKVSPDDLDVDVELNEYGLDSIVMSQLVNLVNDELGLSLAPTVLFEHPNLRAFSAHLADEHGPSLAVRLLGADTGQPAASQAAAPTEPPARPADVADPAAVPSGAGPESRSLLPPSGRFLATGATGITGTEGTTGDEDTPASPAAPQEDTSGATPLSATEPASATGEGALPDDAVAVIGMSGRFPGADDIDGFWENLREGRDCIREVPRDRWDWREYYGDPVQGPDRTDVKWGGFIDGVADFDPLFFGIAPKEALHMDPQQRLLMLYVWKALEDAGHSADSLAGSDLALFVGTNDTGYSTLAERCGKSDSVSPTGGVPSLGPNRMSFFLDVHGPSEPVETACSSSLVAIHRGVTAIAREECETAVVGGVNTIVVPDGHISFSRAGMLSVDGRCKTFSVEADGYGRGEGVGILVLKRLSAAVRDGDHVYGVVRSSAVNHGGRANSLTAPNPRAQADLVVAAWERAGVDPRSVGYVEAHGTGTGLGDPVEVNGLRAAFSKLYADWGVEDSERVSGASGAHVGLGSVKTNIGHLELASGVAGVVKVLLQMRHRTLVESLHCETVNPYVKLEGSPFRLVREREPWNAVKDSEGRELPRRAGVSSFGFGGANAHVVLEEYVPPAATATEFPHDTRPLAILLSGREPETLRARVRQLIDWLDREAPTEAELPRISYTLQVGRVAMDERLAFVTESVAQLRTQLRQFLDGDRPQGVRTGRADRRSIWNDLVDDEDITAAIGHWMAKGKLDRLLKLWVAGAEFDWRQLWGERPPRRIPLPAYPFRLQRYWIADGAQPEKSGRVLEKSGRDSEKPVRTVEGSEQQTPGHTRVLSGDEYFLRDHRVLGVPTLPGAAYLELVREAFSRNADPAGSLQSADSGRGAPAEPVTPLLLRDVTWLRQLQVTSPRSVGVTVDPADGTYEVHAGDGPQREVFARGTVTAMTADTADAVDVTEPGVPAALDIPALQASCPHRLDGEECYDRFESMGLAYGPALRAVETLHHGAGTALSRLVLPEVAAGAQTLNPSMLDAALQTSLGVLLAEQGEGTGASDPSASPDPTGSSEAGVAALPFAVREVRIHAATPAEGWAVARASDGDRPGGTVRSFDIDLCDTSGRVCVRIRGFSTRTVPGNEPRALPRTHQARPALTSPVLMIEPAWTDAEAVEAAGAAGASEVSGTADAAAGASAERRVVLCELPGVDADALSRSLDAECDGWQAEGGIAARYTDYARRLLELIQEEARGRTPRRLVQIVTPSGAPWLGGLSGMLRTARQEHPKLLVQWIEADDGISADELAALLRRDGADPAEVAVRHGGGRRRVSRWRETPPPAPSVPWRDGGVYLFTGGSGGLAALFAEDVARRVQRPTLILCGRSAAGPEQRELAGKLRTLGAEAEYRVLDVSDASSVAAAVQDVVDEHGALHGIVHAAGVLRDGFIARKSADELRQVLAAKVAGLHNLDEAAAGVELDFLIAFSSMAAFGNVGQADYAAANAFMDGYAHHREALRARGERHGRTLSVNWPLWEKGGMRGGEATEALLQDVGMRLMRADTGLDALYRAWACGLTSVVVLEGDHDRMRARLLPDQPDGAEGPERPEHPGQAERPYRQRKLDATNEEQAPASGIARRVTALMTDLLEIDAASLRADVPLREYGLDSIFLTQFLGKARKEFDPTLTLDVIAGCETLRDFIDEIERTVSPPPAADGPAAVSVREAGHGASTRPASEPVPMVRPVAKAPEEFPELIPMNAVREGRPVFWVHHGNGGVESYAPVAERCARPFYGIQPRGWTGSEDILTGQEAMAAYYVDIIRAVQPEGPYDIGGFSLGGLFAYEVVRQLQLQGTEVDTLVMLDTLDASSTNRANSLMTGGSRDADVVAKVSAFRAVNLMLGNNSLDAQDGASTVLHRDEVDTSLDPGAFLDSLVEAAVARGIRKTPAQLRFRVGQLARYFEAVHGERHEVHPLPRREDVRCHYVRNSGGKFFGPFEEYMVLYPDPGLPAVDGTAYWREWADAIDDFAVIDVDTETHAQVMTEPGALKKVLRLCDRLYAPEHVPEHTPEQGGR